jgi:hypothetical protein
MIKGTYNNKKKMELLIECVENIANPEKYGMPRKVWNDIAKNCLEELGKMK